MRKKFIAGNWKMNTTALSGELLAAAIVKGLGGDTSVQVAVCPPFPYLFRVGQAIQGSPVALGAQNCYHEKSGAFTGEVSPDMLVDAGCQYVILGHSERRHKLRESDGFINKKTHAALAAGLRVILCVGETLEEREGNKTNQVLDEQVTAGLIGITSQTVRNMVIAYEPVWAIGTGRSATAAQAQAAHAFIRNRVAALCGPPAAAELVILYGGSATPQVAEELVRQPDIDGGLIGGASLKPDDFLSIVAMAKRAMALP
ncbi:MAG: triose-phosphate isomerase [Gemmataceae bacterium]|nr:triose-phosphate isomerase [Gemmataceae bacterium]